MTATVFQHNDKVEAINSAGKKIIGRVSEVNVAGPDEGPHVGRTDLVTVLYSGQTTPGSWYELTVPPERVRKID